MLYIGCSDVTIYDLHVGAVESTKVRRHDHELTKKATTKSQCHDGETAGTETKRRNYVIVTLRVGCVSESDWGVLGAVPSAGV